METKENMFEVYDNIMSRPSIYKKMSNINTLIHLSDMEMKRKKNYKKMLNTILCSFLMLRNDMEIEIILDRLEREIKG